MQKWRCVGRFFVSSRDIMDTKYTFKLDSAKIDGLRQLIDASDDVILTCHLTPDGDAIGSTLALYHLLRKMDKNVRVVTPDLPPKNLFGLPGAREILPYTRFESQVTDLFANAGLICCLDFNAAKRVDRLSPLLLESKARKVLIDHHLFPEDFADISISHPEMSSTCLLLYHVITALGWGDKITKPVAECIYTGMMTDTGNFTYNSNDPGIYMVIADLVGRGINKDRIYSMVCNSNTVSRLRLNGYAVNEKLRIFPEHRAALISLTQDELNRYHYERGDTESLVNVPLSIPEIIYSIFLREESAYIKVSCRSRGEFPVNKICEEHFNGGGHKNASGGEFYGTMDEAIAKAESLLSQFDKYLPKDNQQNNEKNK